MALCIYNFTIITGMYLLEIFTHYFTIVKIFYVQIALLNSIQKHSYKRNPKLY